MRKIALNKKIGKHILVGDFNLSSTTWPDGQSTNATEKLFLDTFSDLGLEQTIDSPTHQQGRILDLVLTNKPSQIIKLAVLDQHSVCHSDHYGIKFSLKLKVKAIVIKRKVLNYKKADWQNLNKDLNSIDWDRWLNRCEPDIAWKRFKNILMQLIDKHIPSITVKCSKHPPWYDKETFVLAKKKGRLRQNYKSNKTQENYSKYAKCRKQLEDLIKMKMRANFEDDEDLALISKKFYGHLKSTSGNSSIPETVNYGSRFRSKPQDKAELFNNCFADQFSDESKYDIDIDFSNDIHNNIDFDFREIRKMLKNINVNKACGPDGISGKILKNCCGSLAYPLSLIYRLSYNSGIVPQEWKMANVVPVYKKGSKSSVENYRPISLTCLVMKIFEKIIRDDLMSKCSQILNKNQHGFLPGKSCTTQMIGYTESIAAALNESIRTDVIYFDFAKAFDSVNHDIILQKLKNLFNIDGTLLKFLVNYLKDRKQCVIIGGHTSDFVNVTSGVPQGSILGPLLFVIFINDMINCVSNDTHILLYADDTKIWRQIRSIDDHYSLQCDINALNFWATANKMKFHVGKCKVLPIFPSGKELQLRDLFNKIYPLNNIFYYSLDGNKLEYVESEKDLGVHVTSNLSWGQQSDYIYSKASSRLGLLKRALHFVKCPKQKRVFYLAVVRSLFEHCIQIWRPTSDTGILKLERIQKRAVKWVLSEVEHSYNDVEYLARLKNLELLPFKYKFIFSDLLLFHEIFYKNTCIELPGCYTRFSVEENNRLRSVINPPDYFGNGTHTINLQKSRESKSCDLSLKCTLNNTNVKYKSSFFFRTVQEWNRIPPEIRKEENFTTFKTELYNYLYEKAFDFELEPD